MAEAGREPGFRHPQFELLAWNANGGDCLFCAQPFFAPFSALSSSQLLFSGPVSWRLSSASLPLSFSSPLFSWPGPSSSEVRSGSRRHPMELRVQVLAQVPLEAREVRRPPLRGQAPLPLLLPHPNLLPAIRHKRRYRCTRPSHRPDRRESDHRSAYLLLLICGHRRAFRAQGQGIRTTGYRTALLCVTAGDYSTAQFHRQYRAFCCDLRGKLLGRTAPASAGRIKSEAVEW